VIRDNIELLNKIKVIVGTAYNKGASDLINKNMSVKSEMDSAYQIMALFEEACGEKVDV